MEEIETEDEMIRLVRPMLSGSLKVLGAAGALGALYSCADEKAAEEQMARVSEDPRLRMPPDEYVPPVEAKPDASVEETRDSGPVQDMPMPHFGALEDVTVNVWETLRIPVRASHEYLAVELEAEGLPEGAYFDANEGGNRAEFLWIPGPDHAGERGGPRTYEVTFIARPRGMEPGELEVRRAVSITVKDEADHDNDGWSVADGDCDDNNPNTYPVHNNQDYHLSESVRVCPGTYEGVRFFIDHSAVILSGPDVILRGGDLAEGAAITLENIESGTVRGFEIIDYPRGIDVRASEKITLDLEAVINRGDTGISITDSRNGDLRVGETNAAISIQNAHGFVIHDLSIDGGNIYVGRASSQNVIRDSLILAAGVIIGGESHHNTVSGIEMRGRSGTTNIDLLNAHDNVISGNRISHDDHGWRDDALGCSDGDRNTFSHNTVTNVTGGIGIFRGDGNQVIGNTVTLVTRNAGIHLANLTNSLVSGNTVTDHRGVDAQSVSAAIYLFDVSTSVIMDNTASGNDAFGLRTARSQGNDILRNDLSRNPNRFDCNDNICEDNQGDNELAD
jgi:parallel beta-helix repeat protein